MIRFYTLPVDIAYNIIRGVFRWVFELAVQPQVLDLIERQIGPDILLIGIVI